MFNIILQEIDIDKGVALVQKFIKIVKDVVDTVGDAVETFRDILNSDISMDQLIQEFVAALEEFPDMVRMSL